MPIPIEMKEWLKQVEADVVAFFAEGCREPAMHAGGELSICLYELFMHNATLWGYEDEVRREDIADSEIARYKRLIDRENQLRNDSIDQVDAILYKLLASSGQKQAASLPLNTETPGSVFDRLVILQLRRFHLGRELSRDDASAAHLDKCQTKLAEVEERIADLSASLTELLSEIFSGRKRLKYYNAHKLYNDPETNPAVRAAKKQG
ncbi:MAG: DUF4254 domain-containing protein [Planctomycetes bacterium]|nr:DUF4254 domain-containing protein [Planctomycetota bacterium]